MSIILKPAPLTKSAFAPFGDVVEEDGARHLPINQGFAERFDDLAHIDVASQGGAGRIGIFVAKPRPMPMAVDLMERHPLGSQLFYPLQDRSWMIVVAGDPREPDSFRAFTASGQQGVNYARDVWHFPLIVGAAGDRFIVVDRKGPADNLEEIHLPVEARPILAP